MIHDSIDIDSIVPVELWHAYESHVIGGSLESAVLAARRDIVAAIEAVNVAPDAPGDWSRVDVTGKGITEAWINMDTTIMGGYTALRQGSRRSFIRRVVAYLDALGVCGWKLAPLAEVAETPKRMARGRCGFCGDERALKADGTFRVHGRCEGKGLTPERTREMNLVVDRDGWEITAGTLVEVHGSEVQGIVTFMRSASHSGADRRAFVTLDVVRSLAEGGHVSTGRKLFRSPDQVRVVR